MRVGIFSDVFYPYLIGGGENRYYQLAKHLVALGDEVVVITSNLSGCSSYETLFGGKLHITDWGFRLIQGPDVPFSQSQDTSFPLF